MTELTAFTIGPPEPVEDSRLLPVVTADDEAGFVTGADLGDAHPDNVAQLPDEVAAQLDSVPEGQADPPASNANGESLPTQDELDAAVADVDPQNVDPDGFSAQELGFVGLEDEGPDEQDERGQQ
ncbi:hypothetical protein [Pedococcus sp. 5OH_020]|uniref:hypothetical protein n=1 Tax=Pedococcus sp. 5OH_020 TaxID=2989814 RepID=UPI0022E99BC2|nr:hypothetical protein [Pedococcus sp. 5OH_020]